MTARATADPAFLAPRELVRAFTVRHADRELLLERLRERGAPANQHAIVFGERGMGKTMLLGAVAEAVRRDPRLARRWFPIALGEASHAVATAAELWLALLLALAEITGDQRWHAAHRALAAEHDDARLHTRALAALMDFADERRVRLLIVVERLDAILEDQLAPAEGWIVRHTLQTEPRIALFASAERSFAAIDSVEAPLYGQFASHPLGPLGSAECRRLWASISGEKLAGDAVRPIEILCGGSPRLIAGLAARARGRSFGELGAALTELYAADPASYRAALSTLPAAERKVFVTLADLWRPASAAEVAVRARVGTNQASALLHRLAGRHAVAIVSTGRARRYQLTDRSMNLGHLLRSRSARLRLLAAVDFMVALARPEQMKGLARRIDRFVAAANAGQQALASLTDSLEPLEAARALLAGDDPETPHEIVAAARLLCERIDWQGAKRPAARTAT